MKDTIKTIVQRLSAQAAQHQIEAEKCEDAIRALQAVCDHEGTLVDDGHDSHHSYKKCTVCGKRI